MSSQYPQDMTLEEVYAVLHTLKSLHGAPVRAYPSESETRAEWPKLADILILDEIALSSPPEWSYRPTTCFGPGPCLLDKDSETVHKRSHSESAVHVKVRSASHPNDLTCTASRTGTSTPTAASSKRVKIAKPSKKSLAKPSSKRDSSPSAGTRLAIQPHWFHQSLVPRLRQWEFRVLIVTEPSSSPTAVRGLGGKTIKIVKTACHAKEETLAVQEAVDGDFGGDLTGELTKADLEAFSLYVFRRLRSRSDWLDKFESLEVGVRMDVGVAELAAHEHSEHSSAGASTATKPFNPATNDAEHHGQPPGPRFRFFVNEITRWYCAGFFSHNVCGEPKAQICTAYARALTRYIEREMPDV